MAAPSTEPPYEGDRIPVFGRVEGILGVGRIRSDQDIAQAVEERLPTAALTRLRERGLTEDEAYSLVIPRRTLAHRNAKGESLTRDESDRIARISRLVALAEHVFGAPDRAWRWLRKSKRRFSGRAPIELLATEAGGRLIEDLLYQVDYGMLA